VIIRRKKGTRTKTDPEAVHTELERIRGGDPLKLQDVVDESKPKKAVLHPEFEWSNPTAANLWRLYEARKIVQSVEIVDEKSEKPYRAYEATIIPATEVEDAPERVFRPVEEIMADPDLRDELLGRAINDVLALKRRYSGLQELSQVFSAMDDFLKTANP
jgi:hypothetical protein